MDKSMYEPFLIFLSNIAKYAGELHISSQNETVEAAEISSSFCNSSDSSKLEHHTFAFFLKEFWTTSENR